MNSRAFENLDLASMSATDAIWKFAETTSKDCKMMMRLMPITYEFMALAFRNKIVQKAFKHISIIYMDMLIPDYSTWHRHWRVPPADAQEVAIAWAPSLKARSCCGSMISRWSSLEHHIRSGMKLLLEGVLMPA